MMMLLMNSANLFIISNINIVTGNRILKTVVYSIFMLVSFVSSSFLVFLAFSFGWQDALFYLILFTIALFLILIVLHDTGKITDRKSVFLVIAVVAAVLYVTVFSRFGIYRPYIKLDPLRPVKNLIYHSTYKEIKHLMLNIVLFVPLGFAFYMLKSHKFNLLGYTMIGTMFSSGIESVQLILAIGECDTGDVLGNAAGMLIGVLLCSITRKFF